MKSGEKAASETSEFRAFRERGLEGSIYLSIAIGISMILSFYLMDLLLGLRERQALLTLRLGMSGAGLCFALLAFLARRSPSVLRLIPFTVVLLGTVYSALLTHFAGGFGSPYWAGFAFFIVAWECLFPQTWRTSIATSLLYIALYDIILVVLNMARLPDAYASFVASNVFIFGFFTIGSLVSYLTHHYKREIFAMHRDLEREKAKSEELLLNILPKEIADRLKDKEALIADRYEDVSVLFADIVDFSKISSKASAESVIRLLNQIFLEFDRGVERLGLEKIKTIGDCYMAIGGAPQRRPDHLERILDLADHMLQGVERINARHRIAVRIRVGVHCGPVVAGVIGRTKFAYDLWGDTVNLASRMESHGVPGRIQVSDIVFERLKDTRAFECRGRIRLKGMDERSVYLVPSA